MKNKLHPQSDFNFWVPVNFEKSKNKKTGKEEMKIKGIASTNDIDQEGEELIPMGFELNKFLSDGFVNWNHMAKHDPGKIIGEPTLAKVDDLGRLYIEAKLYDNHPLAKSVWELANVLQNNNSGRKLGWSIEGKALERDPMNPKRITKAKILGVAVTHLPVNANTVLEVVKGIQKDDYVDLKFEEEIEFTEVKKGEYLYEFNVGDKTYAITKAFDCVEKKAIVPDIEKEESESQKKIKKVMSEFKQGTLKDSHGNKVTDRDQALAIAMSEAGMSKEKSMDTTSTAPLIPESLEKKPKVLTSPVLKKAIKDGIVPLSNLIEKGGKRAQIGEIREWSGKKYKKTTQGWEPVVESKKEGKGDNKSNYLDISEVKYGDIGETYDGSKFKIHKVITDKKRIRQLLDSGYLEFLDEGGKLPNSVIGANINNQGGVHIEYFPYGEDGLRVKRKEDNSKVVSDKDSLRKSQNISKSKESLGYTLNELKKVNDYLKHKGFSDNHSYFKRIKDKYDEFVSKSNSIIDKNAGKNELLFKFLVETDSYRGMSYINITPLIGVNGNKLIDDHMEEFKKFRESFPDYDSRIFVSDKIIDIGKEVGLNLKPAYQYFGSDVYLNLLSRLDIQFTS